MTNVTSDVSETDFHTLSLEEVKAIASRFEQRVNAALQANPVSKEQVRKTIRRTGADRCPVRLKSLSLDLILHYGDRLADLFAKHPDDLILIQAYEFSIGHQRRDRADRIDKFRVLTEGAEWTDEWGTRWGHAFGGVGATPLDCPIKDWSQLDDYLAHRMPDPHAEGRLQDALPLLQMHGERKYCVGQIHLMLFERLHCLRGMEATFSDLYTNESEVRRLLQVLADYLIELIHEWCKTNISAFFLTDDWGSQTGLMISPAMWKKYFKAHYRRIFDEVHHLGREVVFHSCGNVTQILPELIDLGVDVLHPVQPSAMDLNEVGRQFGGKLCFLGAIDDHRLESSSPQEVFDQIQRAKVTLGAPYGNAYIVSPANALQPLVPFENLQAMFESAHGS